MFTPGALGVQVPGPAAKLTHSVKAPTIAKTNIYSIKLPLEKLDFFLRVFDFLAILSFLEFKLHF